MTTAIAHLQFVKNADEETLKETARQLCVKNLKFLCTQMLDYCDWDTCHDELNEWLIETKNIKFKLILLPRGHLKTSVITIGRTLQDILRDSNLKILLSSAVWNNARTFLTQIKAYLRPGSELCRLFGEFMNKEGGWTQDYITIAQRTTPDKSPTIDTSGLEKTLTSQHYDIIRADDLVTRENITNKDQIDKVITHFKDLMKLLEPGGTMEIIGTRWHDADLYGHIINELTKAAAGEQRFTVYKRQAIENGKPIFPKKFTLESLSALKHTIGSFEYSANYDNDPMDPENQMFKPPVRYWREMPKDFIRVITVDPAGDQASSDWNVVGEYCFSRANQLYLTRYKRGHIDPLTLLDWIFELVGDKTGLIGVGVESIQYQRVLKFLLGVEMRKRGVVFPVYAIIPHKDKFTRLRALQPWWERGDFLLKPGMVEAEEEFARFPVGANDDIMDTAEMALHLFSGHFKQIPIDDPYKDLRAVSPASAREWANVNNKLADNPDDFDPSIVLRM